MGDNSNSGFASLVPGFDFLQTLAQGAAQAMPQLPQLSNWIAPTLDVQELEKRIAELKAVHFWLDQNGKALAATIQALEVQKMTLATLQGMNFNVADLADALKLKPAGAQPEAARKAAPAAKPAAKDRKEAPAAAPVDPMQWWGALTQQFQQIAASAMQDVAQQAAAPAKAAAPRKAAPRKRTARTK